MSVAAVITSRNRPRFARQAYESVLAQTVPADEIVVVDDGSETPLDAADFPSARVLRLDPSRGASAARNQGAQACGGDVLMFLDDDDVWLPEKLAAQRACFEGPGGSDVALVYSGRVIVRDDAPEQPLRRVASRFEGTALPQLWWSNVVGVTSAVAIRRSVFDEVGGFDESAPLRLDYDLWLRCARHGTVRWDGGHHVRYTVHTNPGAQLSATVDRNRRGVQYLLDKYAEEIEALGPSGARRARAEKWYAAARQVRRSSWRAALGLLLRGQLAWPRPRMLALLLPGVFLARLGL